VRLAPPGRRMAGAALVALVGLGAALVAPVWFCFAKTRSQPAGTNGSRPNGYRFRYFPTRPVR